MYHGRYQKLPLKPQWWPGGLIQQKALRYLPSTTKSIALQTAPAAVLAASNEKWDMKVSQSSGPLSSNENCVAGLGVSLSGLYCFY